MLSPAVEKAIAEICASFPDCLTKVDEDGSGGAFVVIEELQLGSPYVQQTTWMGFQITFQYPYADVYPHFVRADLSRLDGQALGAGMGQSSFRGQPAVQISRRSNSLDPSRDTAALKLLKVYQWLRKRP